MAGNDPEKNLARMMKEGEHEGGGHVHRGSGERNPAEKGKESAETRVSPEDERVQAKGSAFAERDV